MMMQKPVGRKKKSAEEAVKDLEKRLAALGGSSPPLSTTATTTNKTPDLLNFTKPNSAPPAPAPAATQSGQVKGGKNALLARITAAKEKAKEAKSSMPAPPAINTVAPNRRTDVLGPPLPVQEAPPQAYNTGLLSAPPAQDIAPPPTFDAVENTVMSQIQPPDYFAAAPLPPPAASAPAVEDLLGNLQTPLPPPMQEVSPEEEMIMGMEGLSQEERRTLLDEQQKIMEQIEREKNANKTAIAAAQADNFDMRSTSNAVSAIGSHSANLVAQNSAVMSNEEATQMEADRKMAETLQNQEYQQGDEAEAERAPRQVRQTPPAAEESWWDTVTGMFTTSEAPGAQQSRSSDERVSLTGASRRPDGVRSAARVAESKPLFSCVVDSVNTTVGALTGARPDVEGNVHGVDSSSLLISNVGRENPNNS